MYLQLQNIFLHAMDAFLTYGILVEGKGYEANPLISLLISYGYIYLFLLKIILLSLFFYAYYTIKPEYKYIVSVGLILANILYIFVVANNLTIAMR